MMGEAPTQEPMKMERTGTATGISRMSSDRVDIPTEEMDMGIPTREAVTGTLTREVDTRSEASPGAQAEAGIISGAE